MPEFELNKLVRNKLRQEYERAGQIATYRMLSEYAHKLELLNKIIEEAKEIKIDSPIETIDDEFADLSQAFKDLIVLCGTSEDRVELARQAKYDKKGGFMDGVFVETLELKDDDEWIEYYRKQPDVFPEK